MRSPLWNFRKVATSSSRLNSARVNPPRSRAPFWGACVTSPPSSATSPQKDKTFSDGIAQTRVMSRRE